jgi:hypothetical protein
MKILDDWLAYYRKRYPVMGTVAKAENDATSANETARDGEEAASEEERNGFNRDAANPEEVGTGEGQSAESIENVASQALDS